MKGNRAFRILFIIKKQTGFAWNFLENLRRCLSPLFQCTLFLMFPLFQKYFKPQVRTNKMVNSVFYHPCPSILASRIQPFIFFKFLRALSLSRMFVEFSTMLHILPCAICVKNFKSMVFAFLENALNLGIFTHAHVPHSNFQAELFGNLFPSTAERGGENHELHYQN